MALLLYGFMKVKEKLERKMETFCFMKGENGDLCYLNFKKINGRRESLRPVI